MERFPDLEIYAKDITFKAIDDWLKQRFNQVERTETVTKKTEARSYWVVDGAEVVAFGNAIGKFTSIWLKKNTSPWNTDLDCARDACEVLDTEIRCSNSGWEEGQGPESQWWRITKTEGEMLIDWPQ